MADLLLSQHIFSLVGPTATGKSSLAVELATELIRQDRTAGVCIISADSRQVYQGLEICTGVDLPPTWEVATQFATAGYQHPEYPIYFFGSSVVEPTAEWSVAHFRQYATPLIKMSDESGFTVILVGGTGLYHEHLFSSDPLLDVPPDEALRQELATLSLHELQEKVQTEAADTWLTMNSSDQQNPRRLVRALEKARNQPSISVSSPELMLDIKNLTHVTLGLTDTPERLKTKISARIEERFQRGVIAEVEKLIANYDEPLWKLPAFSSTGCKEVRLYIDGQLDIDQLKELWLRHELQYAKRQLTWWKTHPYATTVPGFSRKEKQWVDLSKIDQQDWQTEITQSCILGLC